MSPPSGYVVTPAGQQPTRSANDTAEFRRNYGASEFLNGLHALDTGYTGKGVTVGIIDDGAVNVNGELDGRIDAALSKDFGYTVSAGVRTKRTELGSTSSDHGTAVANIIAAAANGAGAVGYAPDVRLAVLRVSDWDIDAQKETLWYAVGALDHATLNRIKVVNSSLSNGDSQMWQDSIARYAQTGGLLVNSAGNAGGANPRDAGAVTDANRAAVIFVGALSANVNAYAMEAYSNLAGTMADRYVVAVGSNVTTLIDGNVGVFAGTSSATPVVTALAADILSKWPQLTGQQAGDVILTTARDIGAPGVDPVFGHGLVDFGAALSPINPTLSNGSVQTSLATSVMAVPTAMSVESIQTALSDVTVVDAYGRDFTGSLAGMVVKPEARPDDWLRRRIQQMAPGGATTLAAGRFAGSLGFVSNRVGPGEGDIRSRVTAGSVNYAGNGYGLRAGWNAQDSMQTDVMGLAPFADGILAYAPQASNSVGVDRFLGGGKIGLTLAAGRYAGASATAATLGWAQGGTDVRVSLIDETGTVMGSPTGRGALRLGRGATTAMVEVHRSVSIAGAWSIEGYGSIGVTRLKIDRTSLVTGSTAILASRLGIQASGPVPGGVLSFGIAQPLVIERGTLRLTYGTAYNLNAQVLTYGTADAGLAGQRRLQLTTGFATGGPRSSLRFGVMQDVSQHATTALAGWSRRF